MHNLKIWNKKREEIKPTHHRTGICKSIIIMYDIIYKYPSFYVNKGELVESSTDNINTNIVITVLIRQKCTVNVMLSVLMSLLVSVDIKLYI